MANRRKPQIVKESEGTARADRDYGEPPLPIADAFEPPDWLNGPDAVELWDHLTGILGPARVLSEGDLTALGHLSNLHGRCVRLWRAGESPTAAELTQLRLYFSEFGMTPASRSKASQIDQPDSGDPAEAFFNRKSG